ncbi:MAG: CgeB family protein [Pararhizobium sp.]
MTKSLDIVFIGLTISSSWGNGHATTYRSLIRGLAAEGHRVNFLERDVPWYAENRDLPEPDFCDLVYYRSIGELAGHRRRIERADAVIIGSYVPEGPAVIDLVAGIEPSRFCFYDIDTPVTLARLRRGDEEFIARRQVPLFDVYFSFAGGRALEWLEAAFGARLARPLFCSVDAAEHLPTSATPRWDLGYLGTYSDDRQPVLERLLISPARALPQMRFVVAGPQYPATIDWPANVERIEHLAPADHAAFYSSQRFTLNVTRSDMVASGWAPSVRLFEAGACATPVISDRWDGLDALFPDGEAVLICDGTDDVVDILSGMPAELGRAIGEAARRIVLERHTGQARAKELVAALTAIAPADGAARIAV